MALTGRIFPGQCGSQAQATRLEKEARLLNIPYRATNAIDLISTQTVMRRYDFPTTAAVRDFAARRGIVGVKQGSRVLYDPQSWEETKAPMTS